MARVQSCFRTQDAPAADHKGGYWRLSPPVRRPWARLSQGAPLCQPVTVLLATLRDDALLDVESAQQTLPAEVQALERAAVKIEATVEASRSYWLTLQAALDPAPGAHSLLL